MRTLTRFVAAVGDGRCGGPRVRSSALSVAHADPVGHDGNRVEGWWDGDTVDIVDDVRGALAHPACWASIPLKTKKARLHRRYLLGSGGNRVREIDPAWGNVSPSSPIRARAMYDRYGPDLGLPGQGSTVWDYSVEAARAGYGPFPTSITGHPSARASEIAAAEQEANGRGPGACGGRPMLGPKRHRSQADSPRVPSPTVRPRRARALSGARRSTSGTGDVVALEFTGGSSGVMPFTVRGDPGG